MKLKSIFVPFIAGLIGAAFFTGVIDIAKRAIATQYTPPATPTTGTVTGLNLSTNINNAFAALQSMNSGGTAPSSPTLGQLWLNTSTSPNTVALYDGTNWNSVGWLDTLNHLWVSNNGGGIGTAIPSAGTTDLCASGEWNPVVSVSLGSSPITSFGSTCLAGAIKYINFTGAIGITYNAGSMILPGVASLTTAAGDTAVAVALGSGNWRVVLYQRANGFALNASSIFTNAVNFDSVISPASLSTNQNNWSPAGLSTANVIRFSCSPTVNITGLAAPATDGQVIVFDNVGTINCTLTANDANSTAANRFLFDKPLVVRPSRTLTVKYDLTSAGWVLWQEVTTQPAAGQFKNLRTLNATNALGDTLPATPNNQVTMAFDQIVLEDANGGTIRIPDASQGSYSVVDVSGTTARSPVYCVADITASGAGGLDTGSVAASTWYTTWLIANPSSKLLSCMFSTSATAPVMPANYTFRMRAGSAATDASANKCLYRFNTNGRIFHYVSTGANAGCSADNSFGGKVFQNANIGTAGAASPTLAAVTWTGNGFAMPLTAVRASIYITMAYKTGSGTGWNFGTNASFSGTGNGVNGSNGLLPAMGSSFNGTYFPFWVTVESTSAYVASSGGTGTAFAVIDFEDNL
jgi:hypothetical protein